VLTAPSTAKTQRRARKTVVSAINEKGPQIILLRALAICMRVSLTEPTIFRIASVLAPTESAPWRPWQSHGQLPPLVEGPAEQMRLVVHGEYNDLLNNNHNNNNNNNNNITPIKMEDNNNTTPIKMEEESASAAPIALPVSTFVCHRCTIDLFSYKCQTAPPSPWTWVPCGLWEISESLWKVCMA